MSHKYSIGTQVKTRFTGKHMRAGRRLGVSKIVRHYEESDYILEFDSGHFYRQEEIVPVSNKYKKYR